MISALLFIIVFSAAFLSAYLVSFNNIRNKTKDVLSRGYFQNANMEEANYLIVFVKGSAYFVKRSSQYTDGEQKEIVQTMLNSTGEIFGCNGRYFYFDNVDFDDGKLYASYDVTAEIRTFRSLLVIFALTIAACTILISLLAWFASKSVFAPLDKALVKQKELIANASHELKTPLAVIGADAELIKDEISGNEQAEKWLASVEYQTKRMQTLIQEMLELSKLEAHNDLINENVDVSDMIESVTLTMEASCFEKQVQLSTDITQGITMLTDRAKLEKLITILLDNAVKYTPRGGNINVSLSKKKSLTLVVQNSGEGIPKDKIDKIFDRFYRQDEAHNDSGSFGLGLAIARSLVEAMQGSIRCDSVENEYTRFTVMLPISKSAASE